MKKLLTHSGSTLGLLLSGAAVSCASSSHSATEHSTARDAAAEGTEATAALEPEDKRPNVVVIFADDMGYSDLGAMGSEIDTPNLDELVGDGRLLTNHHVGSVSAITRAMFMSGADHHQVGLGYMGDNPNPEQSGQPGYENYLNESALSLAELLQDEGYRTYLAGKWHLCQGDLFSGECVAGKAGYESGFDRAYENLVGFDTNHFTETDREDPERTGLPPLAPGIRENGEVAFPPEGVHMTQVFTDKLIEYIDDGVSADGEERSPFFAFAAYMSPHWPLQAPSELIEKYESSGLYDGGYEPVRQTRIARQRELGLLPQSTQVAQMSAPRAYYEGYELPIAESVGNPSAEPHHISALHGADETFVDYHRGAVDRSWELMSADERRAQSKYMAIYAAMVEHLDQQVGRLIQHLKDIGEYDNTLILFHSDNGAEGWPMNDDDPAAVDEWVAGDIARLDQLGTIDQPYLGTGGHFLGVLGLMYGRQWAEVSNTPLSMTKGFLSEGGTRTAAVVKLPGKAKALPPYTRFTHVMDDTATILEIAGVQPPSSPAPGEPDKVLYGASDEQRAVFPVAGQSLLRVLQSENEDAVWRTAFGAETYGRAAIYSADGQWKARFTEPAFGPLDGHWELFRIDEDPGETTDLASEYPELVDELEGEWLAYMERVGGIYPDRPNGYYPLDTKSFPEGYSPAL